MIVYRIGQTKYADDLSGAGARIRGGRWNHKGVPCLYTSETRALAILEYTVNVSLYDSPRALSIASIQIPDNNIYTVVISDLPGNWKASPAPPQTQSFGTKLLQSLSYPIIRIPSIVVPEEYNFLLNPLHADSSLFKIILVEDHVYDLRIKTV